jgi:hypothetical protein
VRTDYLRGAISFPLFVLSAVPEGMERGVAEGMSAIRSAAAWQALREKSSPRAK